MADKTKIEWADATWNPVTGCLHGCEYCYARRIARRYCSNEHGHDGVAAPCAGDCKFCSELDGLEFVGQKTRLNHSRGEKYPFGFWPTFHPHRLDVPSRWTKPRNIFVCSMADLFGEYVPFKWITEVFDACRKAPQHRYLFLTKNPYRYEDLDYMALLPHESNMWYGVTVTGETSTITHYIQEGNTFLSIEPMLGPVRITGMERFRKWVILGAETGNRRGRVVPEKEWISDVVQDCDRLGIPVLMKDSLIHIVGEENMRREFPWA